MSNASKMALMLCMGLLFAEKAQVQEVTLIAPAPVDAMHKTRRSVQFIAEAMLEPINKTQSLYVAIRFGDFVDRVYIPFIESKRRPSTVRGYKQMWMRYLNPRCANWLMHDVETRTIQTLIRSGGHDCN